MGKGDPDEEAGLRWGERGSDKVAWLLYSVTALVKCCLNCRFSCDGTGQMFFEMQVQL